MNMSKYPFTQNTYQRRIVEKCKGLPLAVKTVAGAVRCKRSRESWEEVLTSEIWALPQSDGDVIPALLLSYYELPLHLRQCFGFFSIFPKDHLGSVTELITMWVAQRYVPHYDGKDAEDIGEEYFQELVGRSFLHCKEIHEYPEEEEPSWTMHDLVHDVAKFVMQGEQLHLAIEDPLEVEERDREVPSISLPSRLRTLFLANEHCRGIGQYRSLRILQLTVESMEGMDQIGNLIHLRWLAIEGEAIKSLPKSFKRLELLQFFCIISATIRILPAWICGLHKLRELSLFKCSELEKLPERIHLMTKLRYLIFEGTEKVMESFLFNKIGKLTRLRTFEVDNRFRVIRISEDGTSRSNIGQLRYLNNLRMMLRIQDLDRVATGEEASAERLEDKRFIKSLTLHWGLEESPSYISNQNDRIDDDDVLNRVSESVIEALRPPPSIIRKLHIFNYPGQKLCTWIEDGALLSSLSWLDLNNCIKCTCLPALGRLPCLTPLYISGFQALILVAGNKFSGGLPCLESLKFSHMKNWKAWDTTTSASTTTFPRLRELNFMDCPKLQVVPPVFTTSLVDLTIRSTPICSLEKWAPPIIEKMSLDFMSTTNQLLPDLPSLPRLKILKITKDEHLREIPIKVFDKVPSLESLTLYNCSAMRSLSPGIALDYLHLSNMPTARLLRDSPCLPTVRHLELSRDEELLELPGDALVRFKALQELTLGTC